jgi:DNA-binding beta-propeller fold protein YncE
MPLPHRLAICLAATALVFAQDPAPPATEEQAKKLRELLGAAPKLPLEMSPFHIQLPDKDWNTEYVSWVTLDKKGNIYALHRGLKHDPVLVLDRTGKILRSWGKGLYTIPHSIRIDPDGNIWTTDSGSSVLLKYTPEGKQLLRIEVGEMPARRGGGFLGTADIAFAKGKIYVADGYGNARIVVYDHTGKRLHQWGSPGTGPGQFHLVHGITIDRDNIVYVADRSNGRIQRFDLDGKYLGEWNNLGKTFSVEAAGDGALWIGTHERSVSNESPGWIVRLDRKTGKVLGQIPSPGLHSVTVSRDGELFTGSRQYRDQIIFFKRAAK